MTEIKMDYFDVFTVIVSLAPDLETLCVLRSTHSSLRKFIDANLNTLGDKFGIINDTIDFQNFIYEYAHIRPTLKKRILSEEKLLEVSLKYNDIPGIIVRKDHLTPRDIKYCTSEESLEIVTDNLVIYSDKQFGVYVPYIECDNPKKYYDYLANKFPSWILHWDLVIIGMTKNISNETGSLYDTLGIDKTSVYNTTFLSHSNLLCLHEDKVLEILKADPEIIHSDLFRMFATSPFGEYTRVIEYMIESNKSFVDNRIFEQAIRSNNFSIAKCMARMMKNISYINLSSFSYDSKTIVDLLYLLVNTEGFVSFCYKVLLHYIPYKRDISLYMAIMDLLGDNLLKETNYYFITASHYHNPLQKAFTTKYLRLDPNSSEKWSKEDRRKYEYYLIVI